MVVGSSPIESAIAVDSSKHGSTLAADTSPGDYTMAINSSKLEYTMVADVCSVLVARASLEEEEEDCGSGH